MLIPHKVKNKGKYISFHYLRGWKARKIRKVQEISPQIPICGEKIIMIRALQKADIDSVTDIWLDTNLKAHDSIPTQYWNSNYDLVK